MREWYKNYKPQGEASAIMDMAMSIIAQYQLQGLKLTLRQLYYQFVSRDLLPNTEKSYKRLGMVVSRGRLGGYLDWEAIEDRVRTPVVWAEYDSVEDLLDEALRRYRLPRLEGQETYVELWVEKDALAGVLEPIAAQYHVTLMVNRGYSSSSAMKEAGDRVRNCCDKYGCSRAMVMYLGDLDPSGEDMVRDIRDRLGAFLNCGQQIMVDDEGGVTFEELKEMKERKPLIRLRVKKLALTMKQVEEHNPPPNPTKLSDSRAKDFIEKYGSSSWEVDALDPLTLRTIIEEEMEATLDLEQMKDIQRKERRDRNRLERAVAEMKATDMLEDDDGTTDDR